MSQKSNKSHKSIAELERENSMLKAEVESLRTKLDHMNEILLNMQRARFGQSSEKQKYVSPDQLSVFNEAELEQNPKAPEPDEKTIIVPEHKRKPKGSLEDKIKELPSEDVFLDIPEDEKVCSSCGKPLRRMGKKFLRREIQSIPKSMKVVNYYAYTYTCDYCEKEKGVSRIYSVQAPEPLIKHSYASPSLVADVMTQKYVDGVPLARQEKIWQRDGFALSRATMANWIIKVAEKWLKPLYKLMKKQLLASNVIYADETVVQVLKEEGKTPQSDSRMWVYGSDLRRQDAAERIADVGLRQRRTLRQGDKDLRVPAGQERRTLQEIPEQLYGLSGNGRICGLQRSRERHPVRLLGAYAQMPKGATMENSKAAVGYNYCNKLFALERKWKNLNNAQREENRRNQAERLVDEYFLWVRSVDPVSGSKLEDAVKYALNQEKYLRAFLNNGEVEISNNFAENAIRPFVIGRKNWLFSDTVKGAKSSAIVYSLIETAKANSVEPYSYLALVLTDMQYMGKPFSNEELESLMPWSEEMKQSIVRRTKPTSSSDE